MVNYIDGLSSSNLITISRQRALMFPPSIMHKRENHQCCSKLVIITIITTYSHLPSIDNVLFITHIVNCLLCNSDIDTNVYQAISAQVVLWNFLQIVTWNLLVHWLTGNLMSSIIWDGTYRERILWKLLLVSSSFLYLGYHCSLHGSLRSDRQ